MKHERNLIKILIIAFALGSGLASGIAFALPDSNLHLVVCDVGQGDAILVKYRSTQVLVDGGPGSKVTQCLSRNLPFWDREL